MPLFREAFVLITYSFVGYLCGSCVFSLWIPRWLGKSDPRRTGSGNIGATNVFRSSGWKIAAAVFVCDVLKGWIPVFLCPIPLFQWTIGLGCVLGHLFPWTAQFKGGKAVATSLGVFMAISPVLCPIGLLSWWGIWSIKHYVSVASLGALYIILIWFLFLGSPLDRTASLCLALLVTWAHRHNLIRLYKKQEPQTGKQRCS